MTTTLLSDQLHSARLLAERAARRRQTRLVLCWTLLLIAYDVLLAVSIGLFLGTAACCCLLALLA